MARTPSEPWVFSAPDYGLIGGIRPSVAGRIGVARADRSSSKNRWIPLVKVGDFTRGTWVMSPRNVGI